MDEGVLVTVSQDRQANGINRTPCRKREPYPDDLSCILEVILQSVRNNIELFRDNFKKEDMDDHLYGPESRPGLQD